MKKFKKIIVGAMLVMALGTFTACGNNDDNVNDTTGTQDNVTNDAANDETTGSNKNKNNNNNDNDTDNAGNAVGDAMKLRIHGFFVPAILEHSSNRSFIT